MTSCNRTTYILFFKSLMFPRMMVTSWTLYSFLLVLHSLLLFALFVFSSDVKIKLQGTELYNKLKPKYMKEPLLERHMLHSKLTLKNRQNMELGVAFRSVFKNFRLLTREEERIAGKFSNVGKQLKLAQKMLTNKLGRSPTVSEWASFCHLSVTQLEQYDDLAKSAKNTLMQHNIKLVDFWARRLIEHVSYAKDVSYYELLTEGIIGLAKAAENFDGRGPFIKYAQPFVKAELYKGLTSLRPGSFLSHRTVMLGYRINRTKERLEEILGRTPTDIEVATEMKLSTANIRSVLFHTKLKKTVLSAQTVLQGPQNSGGGSSIGESPPQMTYLDLFLRADQAGNTSDQLLWKTEFQQALDSCLTPTEKRTLTIRFGLDDGKSRSVELTAQLMGFSTESVRKTILTALEKLKHSNYSERLQEGPPEQPITTSSGKLGLPQTF